MAENSNSGNVKKVAEFMGYKVASWLGGNWVEVEGGAARLYCPNEKGRDGYDLLVKLQQLDPHEAAKAMAGQNPAEAVYSAMCKGLS